MGKKLREKPGHKRANILGQRNTEKEETMQKDEHEKEKKEVGNLRNQREVTGGSSRMKKQAVKKQGDGKKEDGGGAGG